MNRLEILQQQARKTESKIVLLILDGVGDIRTEEQPQTALEAARTPHLDQLCSTSCLGRLIPASTGITPGSGPGHLGLFGYDPTLAKHDIGRGVLEALGLGLQLGPETVAARCNFATADSTGIIADRRAGRIPTEEGERICKRLHAAIGSLHTGDVNVRVAAGEGYRFVLLFDSATDQPLDAGLLDTDPQRTGVPLLELRGETAEASRTADRLRPLIEGLQEVIRDEEKANSFSMRGFSTMPHLPSFTDLYQLQAGCFAGYPLYRGVASACGMEVVECGKRIADLVDAVGERFDDFDFFFLHVKQTDQAGEDGDIKTKIKVIEEVDQQMPRLLALQPDVVAITGDHSTPAPMKAHSWHPVPLLVHGAFCGIDDTERFTELEAADRAGIGRLPSAELMGLLLANAGKLAKFGA